MAILEDGNFLKCLGEVEFVLGLDAFPDQPECVAVCDGGVVVILVDVVAEECLGAGALADERCAGEADLDGLRVGLIEIREEAAAGIVAAVDLVEEIDALELDVVIRSADDVGVVPEFLDINDGDLGPTGVIVNGAGGLDVAGEGVAGIDGVDDEAAGFELVAGLHEQVDAIDDEIEFRDGALFMKIGGQVVDVVVGQRSFTAALGVPDDALAEAGFE